MNRRAIKCRESEAGKGNIEDKPHYGQSVSVTDENHRQRLTN